MKSRLLILLVLIGSLTACIDEEPRSNTPTDNFEALWQIMDERYCFFDYKQVDWDSIHSVYSSRISNNMANDALFDTLAMMLSTLRDGHVNLYSSHDVGRYWAWQENHLLNFHEELLREYLSTDYRIAGAIRYKILLPDSIGYIYMPTFSQGYSDSGINNALYYMKDCAALIIDIRGNTGGSLEYAESMASHLDMGTDANDGKDYSLIGYKRYKTGKGHNDFSSLREVRLSAAKGVRWLRPTAILTNRQVFSAANWFVSALRDQPHIIQIGDRTGGGSGFPMSSELPNGWGVRYSATQMLNAQKQQIEFGIRPHIHANVLLYDDFIRKSDNIIETARLYLRSLTERHN